MRGFLRRSSAGIRCIAFIIAEIERSIKDTSRGLTPQLDKLMYDAALVAKDHKDHVGRKTILPLGIRHSKPSSLEGKNLFVLFH